MVEVTLWGSLASLAEGNERISVEATDIRELFRKLSERYPGLREPISRDVAVAIDGVIYRDNWSKQLPENGEVFLMRRLEGG